MTGGDFEKDCNDCFQIKELNMKLRSIGTQLKVYIALVVVLIGTGAFTIYKYNNVLEKFNSSTESIVAIETTLKMAVPDLQKRITDIERNERIRLENEIKELKRSRRRAK